jgi:hypothetical protein
MGRFARLAQAAHLLSHVFRHVSDRSMDIQLRLDEATQLERTLHALILYTESESQRRQLSFCCQMAMSHR